MMAMDSPAVATEERQPSGAKEKGERKDKEKNFP